MEKIIVMLGKQIDINEVGEAYEMALEKMTNGENPWFNNEDEAEAWAGDIAFDLVMNILETLGFEIVDE
jgi:hypothetical protein